MSSHSALLLRSNLRLLPEGTAIPATVAATGPLIAYSRFKISIPPSLSHLPEFGLFPRPSITHVRTEPRVMPSGNVTGSDMHTIAIPYWLILACYLPLWLGVSWWRGRRITKGLELL